MNTWDFSSSKLKCKRAGEHIKELDSRLAEWFDSDAFKVFIDTNPDTGNKFFQFTCAETLPQDIPVIIGDIIHNLRSALDHIAIEIVRKAGLGLDNVYFPIRETEADLIDAVSKSKIKLASVQAADVILDGIKPYKARNPFIWSLNRLSNTDKHKLLIPVLSKVEFPRVSLEHDDEVAAKRINFSVYFRGTSTRSGDIIGLNSSKLEIKDHGDPSLTVFFDETQIAGIAPNQPVVFLLKRCEDLIGHYIPRFESI